MVTLCAHDHEQSVMEGLQIMTEERSLRSMQAQIAALTRAARSNGSEMTAAKRAAFLRGFETRHECKYCGVIEINQDLPPAEHERAATAARSAHFRRLALRSKASRLRARKLYKQARDIESELAAELADLDNAV
jgi:hypothetical protein